MKVERGRKKRKAKTCFVPVHNLLEAPTRDNTILVEMFHIFEGLLIGGKAHIWSTGIFLQIIFIIKAQILFPRFQIPQHEKRKKKEKVEHSLV